MQSQNLLEKHQIAVFYEDPNLLVLSKPSGLLSQGEKTGDINLVDILREYFGRHYVGLIHRLDRNTSGLMIIAKRSKAAERLSESLKSGALQRGYQAWLHGTLKTGSSEKWEDLILKNEKTNISTIVRGHPKAKSAVLNFKVIKNSVFEGSPISLVEFNLDTGRSHQIRVQSSHRGHPILGDKKYGAKDGYKGLALHSYFIKFQHPISKEVLDFRDEIEDFSF